MMVMMMTMAMMMMMMMNAKQFWLWSERPMGPDGHNYLLLLSPLLPRTEQEKTQNSKFKINKIQNTNTKNTIICYHSHFCLGQSVRKRKIVKIKTQYTKYNKTITNHKYYSCYCLRQFSRENLEKKTHNTTQHQKKNKNTTQLVLAPKKLITKSSDVIFCTRPGTGFLHILMSKRTQNHFFWNYFWSCEERLLQSEGFKHNIRFIFSFTLFSNNLKHFP